MKKVITLLILVAYISTACSSDDKPTIPKLKKLTKISCTKNTELTPEFTAEIRYNSSGGTIDQVIIDQYDIDQYLYAGNQIVIQRINSSQPAENTVNTITHTVRNGIITETILKSINAFFPHLSYESNVYSFMYELNYHTATAEVLTWPSPDNEGKYETRDLGTVDKFTWERGNLVRYTYSTTDEMVYEYNGGYQQPENFPFRINNSFKPVTLDNFNPVNSYYGKVNQTLPQSAYTYLLADPHTKRTEYTFNYTFTGEYITSMTIIDKNNYPGDGENEMNTYVYSFNYDYDPN